ASARLCRLLDLDPSVRLRTPGGPVEPMRLVPEDADPGPLVAEAVWSRPEVSARSVAVLEAQTRRRQEQVRPWLPLVAVGSSGGLLGGGRNLVERVGEGGGGNGRGGVPAGEADDDRRTPGASPAAGTSRQAARTARRPAGAGPGGHRVRHRPVPAVRRRRQPAADPVAPGESA